MVEICSKSKKKKTKSKSWSYAIIRNWKNLPCLCFQRICFLVYCFQAIFVRHKYANATILFAMNGT